ncbi:MAG: LacI family transcriptional regulator [Anaerolineales bacterium]|nr:LacI family transcriptional regulator [Anaerolineales bacterium]MDW8162641.1 LacI family DNA-binding transcriptional regulator [Anaerolineales bacterium]
MAQENGTPPNTRKRVGLREVAKVAQTSIATVSRVLNNTGYVSEESRRRVLEAVRSLNYQPNLRAKALRQRYSRTIGLIIPNLLNAYYTALADQISLLLNQEGFQLLLSSTRDDLEIERDALLKLIGHDVDGLIWVPTSPDEGLLRHLCSQNIPTVCIVRQVKAAQLDTIVFEDFKGAKAATEELIKSGHRRIGYIGGDVGYSSNYDRWQGFLAAIREAGLPAEECYVRLGTLRSEWGAKAAEELLHLQPPPTAFFVASNAIMPGVIKTLRSHRIKIPEQISLICFDDLDWFSFSQPPISAVATSHTHLAQACVELLLRRIRGEDTHLPRPYFNQISFEIVRRASIAPPSSLKNSHPKRS